MRIKGKFDHNKIFFTSDTHWRHKNIIKFCNRPFSDVSIMDEAFIQNWNRTIPEDGIVFHAGDFAMTGQIDFIRYLVSRLNGSIYLIMGNHDYQNRFDRPVIKEIFGDRVMDVCELIVYDERLSNKSCNFFISHYPHLFWHRGSYHLHGHVHSGINSTANEKVPYHSMRYDIGVDNNDYNPISYNKLVENVFKIVI
jgi:calcineurin-like phosphoesterase family protein